MAIPSAACAPYHFHPDFLEKGKAFFESLPFNYKTSLWWQSYVRETHFSAKWVPLTVPMLIISGSHDAIVTGNVFQDDHRFQEKNISQVWIPDAGHFPFIENVTAVTEAIQRFQSTLK